MSHSSEAKDYKLLSFKTSARVPETEEKTEIIKFNENTKVLKNPERKTFNEMTYSFLKRTVDVTASAAALSGSSS